MPFEFDPQRAVEKLRQLADDAPSIAADGFGRLMREAPPERIEQVMRSPARKAILDGIFWRLPKQIDSDQAIGVKSSILWCITGRADGGVDAYQLQIDNGRAWTVKGDTGADPRLTITMDAVEFLRLASGNSDPMQAYFKGRVQMTGDIMVAAKLAQLLRMPGTPSQGPGGGGNGDAP
jgi:alkyl sulfatase BDS1-like metallo-beta-lactamase superfamily hydrolase